MERKGILTVVSGFSGSGKGTLMKKLLGKYPDTYALSVSATTRAPRDGEQHGREYFFITKDEFEKMIAKGELIEYARYVENYYGTPRGYVEEKLGQGKDVILDIEVQGAIQVTSKRPDAVRIFIAPPSWAELERRLTERGTDSPDKVQKRLLRAKVEFQTAHTYDYFVINDTVENAVNELNAIMTAEHCKPKERMEIISVL